MIVKLGSKYRLLSKDGKKNLGTFDSKAEAEKHEQDVNYFKSHPKEAAMGYDEQYPRYMAFREANEEKLMVSEAITVSSSFDSIRQKVSQAINANVAAGTDMDCDGDGPQDAIEGQMAWVMDMWPGQVVYSMCGRLFQCDYALDADGDCHLGDPMEVERAYEPVPTPSSESFTESCDPFQEAAYDQAKGVMTVTVIKPGLSKNNRFYPADMLRRDHKVFEGAKMFADHQTEAEAKARPEGSVRGWVGNLTKVWAEKDGTVKGSAVVIDPAFKGKLDMLHANGMLPQMGVSIRAMGEAKDGEVDGKKAKIVENIQHAKSVDFVTFAGAGGQVEEL